MKSKLIAILVSTLVVSGFIPNAMACANGKMKNCHCAQQCQCDAKSKNCVCAKKVH